MDTAKAQLGIKKKMMEQLKKAAFSRGLLELF
jgi:hypothetical protein